MNKKNIVSLLLLILTVFLASVFYIYQNSRNDKRLGDNNRASNKKTYESRGGKLRGASISSPFVIKKSNVYKMWFMLKNASLKHYISQAISTDGITWNKRVKKPALIVSKNKWDNVRVGSPSIIAKDKKYLMFYRGDGMEFQQIGYAASQDGINWKKHFDNPVFTVRKNKWDSKSLVAPHVLYDQSLYKLYYRGSRQLDQDFSSIGFATSPDGLSWIRSTNPILAPGVQGEWDDKQVGDPSVIYNRSSNLYQMWYSGESSQVNAKISGELKTKDSGYGKMIGYATSKDGVNWEKYNHNPVLKLGKKGEWDWTKVDNPFVLFEKGIYKMWYRGSSAEFAGIGYTTSSDGINWKKYKGNPVLRP